MTADAEGNPLGTLQILRQQGIQLDAWVGTISAEAVDGAFTTPAAAGPDLSGRLPGVHKQNEAFTLGAMGQKQCHRIRLIQTGEVPEITVLTERPLGVGMVGDQR